ncbi:MAG: hypothetical protein IJT83_14720 [Victivallales bacterium]|nr:hypothetical protein [Victivallales bacterium]
MDIKLSIEKIVFHPEKVAQVMRRKTASVLRSGVKYLHKTAKRMIRSSQYPSKPGQPPHTRGKGKPLQNAIHSEFDDSALVGTVGIAPSLGSKKRISSIAAIHEFGGKGNATPDGRYKVGDWGPIELTGRLTPKQKTRWNALALVHRFTLLKTPGQAARANSLASRFFGKPLKSTSTYPERPFLAPALKAAWPKIMEKFGTPTP